MSYMLFAGDTYYPGGGWNDYQESFSSTEEAIEYLARISYQWAHIVDSINKEMVWSK
jgi:hypothetical protein